MGTRNLTKVIDKDGEIRVAQYGQWDGYPEYSGTRMLSFISEHGMLEKIEKSLVKCRLTTNAGEIDAAYDVYSDEPKWEELRNDFNGYGIAFPSLSRDTGVDILKVIVYSNEEILLWNDAGFQNDQLMCEGIYTLDYKTREFVSTYHSKTVSFSLDALPTAEEYLKAFESEEVVNA